MKGIILALALLAPLTTNADELFFDSSQSFVTGNVLYGWCTEPVGSFNVGLCEGYIEAVSDVADALKSLDVCTPQHVTVQEVVDIVKKYLADNPAKRHFTAYGTVINALSAVFPCPKRPAPSA